MSNPSAKAGKTLSSEAPIGCPVCGDDEDLAANRALTDATRQSGLEPEDATKVHWCFRCGYASAANRYQTSEDLLEERCRPELRRFARRSARGLIWWPEGAPHMMLLGGVEADIRPVVADGGRLAWRRSDYGTDRPAGFVAKFFAEIEAPSQGHPHADYETFTAAVTTSHDTHHVLARILPLHPTLVPLPGR